MIEKCKNIFKTKKSDNKFLSVNGPEDERSLLEAIWSPLFAVFSIELE